MEWQLYADGSAQGLSGGKKMYYQAGGWAAIAKSADIEKTLSGCGITHGPNSMELRAVVKGLQYIDASQINSKIDVTIYNDSVYVLQTIFCLLKERDRHLFLKKSTIQKTQTDHMQQLKRNPARVHEDDNGLFCDLQKIIDHFYLRFIQVSKISAPKEHMDCHFIASSKQRDLASRMITTHLY